MLLVALARGAQATGSFIYSKVQERKLGLYAGSCYGEERVLHFFFTDFLEGAQVSGRWQQDETQRQPGERLEGEPGSGSSQVLSWSALDKREAASLHMLLIAMPDHKEVPIDSLPLSLEEIWDSWRRNNHFLGKTVWNCVESRKLSQLAICQLLLEPPYGEKKKWKNERESFLKSSFRSAFEIREVKDIICP